MATTPLEIHTSTLPVTEIIDRIAAVLREKGVNIFARISHSKAAAEVGLTMPDEELIVFGSPKVGTALMLENPAIGIELPLKIIAWRVGDITQVAYQKLEPLASAYKIEKTHETVVNLQKLLKNLVESVLH